MVSKSMPRIPASVHPKNIKDTCPATKQMPTSTFHARSSLGPGLNLLITNPDNKNPSTMPTSDMGPEKYQEAKKQL